MSQYAIVNVAGHQYCVQENEIFEVESFLNNTADTQQKEVKLDQVLLVGSNGSTKIGQPYVSGASVVCEVLGDVKQPKVISFKIKRRKGYRRKVGHRQVLTRLQVKSITAG